MLRVVLVEALMMELVVAVVGDAVRVRGHRMLFPDGKVAVLMPHQWRPSHSLPAALASIPYLVDVPPRETLVAI